MKKSIVLNDRIYGKETITSPILITLILSHPLQRLKKIAQLGVPDPYYHLKNFSRFEHSVGVMHLLKKLHATEEEQMAGLLHDVSHTAFSHVVDYLMGSISKEDYQDSQHESIITSSEIALILSSFGYNAKRIADYHHFSLLEQDMPNLCADRVDYALREFPPDTIKTCLDDMTSHRGKIVFTTKKAAQVFANNFLYREKVSWGSFEAVSRYTLFSSMLRYGLEKKIITFDDLWKYDSYVIKKLQGVNDEQIKKTFTILLNPSLEYLPKSETRVKKKFRYVDPEIRENDALIRLSSIDEDYAQTLKTLRKEREEGVLLPLFGVFGI